MVKVHSKEIAQQLVNGSEDVDASQNNSNCHVAQAQKAVQDIFGANSVSLVDCV